MCHSGGPEKQVEEEKIPTEEELRSLPSVRQDAKKASLVGEELRVCALCCPLRCPFASLVFFVPSSPFSVSPLLV